MKGAPGAPRLDVALALHQIVLTFWHDFAPIVVLGFVMVTVPGVAQQLIGPHAGSTIVATLGAMLNVLYVVIVSGGVLARLTGKPLPPLLFARAGLAASPRGLSVALLIGAGLVMILVILLLAGTGTPAGLVASAAAAIAAFACAVMALPAVPVALVERGAPFAALARAAALTRGERGRIAVLLVVLALTFIPARMVIAATVYGTGANLATEVAIDRTMTVFSPGLWLLALFDLLAWGVAATVPAVVYVQLARVRRG